MFVVAKFPNIAINDFDKKKSALCSLVLNVLGLLLSGTQCNIIYHLIDVTGYQIASLGFSHFEIQGFYRTGKFNCF